MSARKRRPRATDDKPTVVAPHGASHKIVWSARALTDLDAIGDFIARDNPAAAKRWVDELFEHATMAAHAPRMGRVVPEIRADVIRELLLRSYRIVYQIEGDEIRILTVFEGHRRFPSDAL